MSCALPARRRARPGRAGGGALRARTHARARPDTRDRRHPRRSGGAGTALRLVGPRGARAARRRARAPRAAPERRRADDLRVHVAGSCARPASSRRPSSPRSWISSRSSSASPSPLPERRVALFVGVLERYKAVDVLADAWRLAAPRVPEATLQLVGRGTLRDVPRAARRRPPRTDALDGVAADARGRARARRGHRARPPVAFGGSRPRRRRGVLPRPRRRRKPCRRHPGHRRGRRDGHPRPARGRRRRSPTRSSACSRIVRSPSGSAQRAHAAVQPWLATPEEYARRIRDLVDDVTG